MIECRAPKSKTEFEQNYQLRWQILRAPWHQSKGSEQDKLEQQSIHRCIFNNNTILATARLHFVSQHETQIRYMAVNAESQGIGYGKMLIHELEKEAVLRGAKRVELNAREGAVKFYQRLGYELLEKSHCLYGQIQHFKMCKTLAVNVEHMQVAAQQLQNTWYQTIPLSKAMNIEISFFDQQQIVTQCDPIFNKNIHHTMFAGSIYTLATLTGWGWVYLLLEQNGCEGDIVLADAKIEYKAPIVGAVCAKTDVTRVQGNIEPLQNARKARISLQVDVMSGDVVAAKFSGRYVVLPKGKKQ